MTMSLASCVEIKKKLQPRVFATLGLRLRKKSKCLNPYLQQCTVNRQKWADNSRTWLRMIPLMWSAQHCMNGPISACSMAREVRKYQMCTVALLRTWKDVRPAPASQLSEKMSLSYTKRVETETTQRLTTFWMNQWSSTNKKSQRSFCYPSFHRRSILPQTWNKTTMKTTMMPVNITVQVQTGTDSRQRVQWCDMYDIHWQTRMSLIFL